MELIIYFILLISSTVSFGIGVKKYFGKKTALFKILITSSIGCFMLGKLYEVVYLFFARELNGAFNIGMIANIGGLLFLFSASFSQMDGLVDDRSKKLSKYRRLSIIAPSVIMSIYVYILLSDIETKVKVSTLVIYIFIALASYYNLKHTIIPDVSFGIIDSIRHYNHVALIMELLLAVQILSDRLGYTIIWELCSILIAITYPCILIIMDRGTRKWTL